MTPKKSIQEPVQNVPRCNKENVVPVNNTAMYTTTQPPLGSELTKLVALH